MTPLQLDLTGRRAVAVGAVAGLACFALVIVAYRPLLRRVAEDRTALRELRVKIADARTLIGRLPTEEAALEQATGRASAVERRIGSGQSVARVLDALQQQAKNHRLELIALQPRAEDQPAGRLTLGLERTLRETPLILHISGRYRHLGEFLGGLADAPFLASVRRVTIAKPEPGRPTLKAEVVLAVYLPEHAS